MYVRFKSYVKDGSLWWAVSRLKIGLLLASAVKKLLVMQETQEMQVPILGVGKIP